MAPMDAAGNGDKQNREQIAGALHVEAGKGRQIHGGVGHEHADHRRHDHGDQQIAVQVVTGLKQRPDRDNGSDEDVGENDNVPGTAGHKNGHIQAKHNRGHQHNNRDAGIDPLIQLGIAQKESKDYRHYNKEHGSGCHGAVGRNLGTLGIEAFERAGNHIRECRNHQDAEQPAECQKELLADLADVTFDDVTDRASLVLHGGVHGNEVLHRAEENAADENPQQHRHPAKDSGLNGAVDGACTRNGCKLMAKNHVGIGRLIVNAVLQVIGRCLGVRVNAPGLGEPSAVEQISAAQYHNGNHHDENTVQ